MKKILLSIYKVFLMVSTFAMGFVLGNVMSSYGEFEILHAPVANEAGVNADIIFTRHEKTTAEEKELLKKVYLGVSPTFEDETGKKLRKTCSLTRIGPDLFFTAAHCVDNVDFFYYYQDEVDASQEVAEKYLVDRENDIALLKAHNLSSDDYFELGDDAKVGQSIRAVGYGILTDAFGTMYNEKKIIRQTVEAKNNIEIRTKGSNTRGDSGGAIVDDDGKLVAVTIAVETLTQGENYGKELTVSINISKIKELLNSYSGE